MTTTDPSLIGGLAGALAAFQRELPRIGKGNTAQVKSDKASYSYRYADLADISAAVLPALARHDLAWSTTPTLDDEGRLVLRYKLMHSSGESEEGIYPLPPATSLPQVLGSAITYARRYCLCAVTGVSPDDDDDGAAAQYSNTQYSSNGRDNGAKPAVRDTTSPTAERPQDWPQRIKQAEEAKDLPLLRKLLTEARGNPELLEQIKAVGVKVKDVLRQEQMNKLFALLAEGGVKSGDEHKPQRLRIAANLLARKSPTSYADLSDTELAEFVTVLTGLKKVGTLTQRLIEFSGPAGTNLATIVNQLLSALDVDAAISLMEEIALRDDADVDVANLLKEPDREALGLREGYPIKLLDLAEKVGHYTEKHKVGPRVVEPAAA